MWQAEIRVDVRAIRDNVAALRGRTQADLMAVVKADGYGHGLVNSARAALAGGATWLGAGTIHEAMALRAAGIKAPILAWLWLPDADVHGPGFSGEAGALTPAVAEGIDLSAPTLAHLSMLVEAAHAAGRPARVHLKVDTGLHRSGATPADWPALLEAAAKAQADGDIEVIGVWSHLARADEPEMPTTGYQVAAFEDALAVAARIGVTPQVRHLANSAGLLLHPQTHYDLVRPGIAMYGLTPAPGLPDFGVRPAMTARARVMITKRVPAGSGVSYGHTYTTSSETTLAVVPFGYADGAPRHASNVGPVQIAGERRYIAGRVCMDQFVIDCGDLPVEQGDDVILFGPGDDGEPTADDWAAAIDTIGYEIVTRIGSARIRRTSVHLDATEPDHAEAR